MTKDEVLKLALEALEEYANVVVSVNDPNEWTPKVADAGEPARKAITAIKEALAQRSFDYKEHAEGLQRDYDLLLAEYNELKAQQEQEPWSNVEIGVDVTADGTHVVGMYVLMPDVVRHVFYSQFHTAPQRTWVGLTDEQIDQLLPEIVNGGTFTVITYGRAVARAIEAEHGIKG